MLLTSRRRWDSTRGKGQVCRVTNSTFTVTSVFLFVKTKMFLLVLVGLYVCVRVRLYGGGGIRDIGG